MSSFGYFSEKENQEASVCIFFSYHLYLISPSPARGKGREGFFFMIACMVFFFS